MRIDGATYDQPARWAWSRRSGVAQVVFTTAEKRPGVPGRRHVSAGRSRAFDDMDDDPRDRPAVISGARRRTHTYRRSHADAGPRRSFFPRTSGEARADPALSPPGMVEEVIVGVTPLNNFFRSAATDTVHR